MALTSIRNRLWQTGRSQVELVRHDAVMQNSVYLMASTVVMALFGFVFWMINARIFTTEQVGLASSLIAIATTMSMFSQLGFDHALVRFLPSSKSKDRVIDTALIVAAVSSLVITTLFLALLPIISPKLNEVIVWPAGAIGFIAAMVLLTNNTLTDSIFIAHQEAKYIFFIDIILGLTRVSLPLLLVGLGAYGLFAAHAGAVIVASIVSLAVIVRRYRYRFRPVIDGPTIKNLASYSTGSYVASLSEALPLMILPILVTNTLGAHPAAFFYAAMMVANLIFIIPRAMSNSLLADNSRTESASRGQYWSTLRRTAVILVPAVVFIVTFGHLLLLVFGPDYANGGQDLLRLFAISALVVAFNVITAVQFKIAKNVRRLVIAEVTGTATILALFYPLATQFGLTGVGYAWLAGQLAITTILVLTPRRRP
jgi:O-antigen/teichoic acid export membrane protein